MHKIIDSTKEWRHYDKGIGDLVQTSMSNDAWVEYSKFIQYISNPSLTEEFVFEGIPSFCLHTKNEIDKCTPFDLENLVQRQSGDLYSQIAELISNSIDATVEKIEIGKFGKGFKQVFQEFKYDAHARILVITKAREAKYGRLIEFALIDNQVHVRDGLNKNISEDILEHGTRIIVIRALSTNAEKQQDIKRYVEEKFCCCMYAKIQVNGKLINDFSGIEDVTGASMVEIFEANASKTIFISIKNSGYEVQDNGKGMTDEVIYMNFLNKNSSTKKESPGGEAIYFKRVDQITPEKISLIQFVVCGVVIEEHKVKAVDLPARVILCLPHATLLSSARKEVHVNQKLLIGIEEIIKNISAQEELGDFRLDLINCIVTALKILDVPTRVGGQEQSSINDLRSEIKKKLLEILDPKKIYLPRINACQYFAISLENVGYLDPTIYPEQVIERVPDLKRIHYFENKRVNYKVYHLPFRTEPNLPIYIEFGRVLVFDSAVYEFYKDMPEALNLILNHWSSYGYKPQIKGLFRKVEKEIVVDDEDIMEDVKVFEEDKKETVIDGNEEGGKENSERSNQDQNNEKQKDEDSPVKLKHCYDRNDIEDNENENGDDDLEKEIRRLMNIKKQRAENPAIEIELFGDRNQVKKQTEQLVKEILKDYQLVEEKIMKELRTSSRVSGGLIHWHNMEDIIKDYVRESLEQREDEDNIKNTVKEFLSRYVMLGIKKIAMVERNIDKSHIKIREIFPICEDNRLKKITNIVAIISVAKTVKDIYWIGRYKDSLYYVYKNTKKITEGYEEIQHLIVSDDVICWVVKKNEKWALFHNESPFDHEFDAILKLAIIEKDTWWVIKNKKKFLICCNNDLVAENFDDISDLRVFNKSAWWIGKKNEKDRPRIYQDLKPIETENAFDRIKFLHITTDAIWWVGESSFLGKRAFVYRNLEQVGRDYKFKEIKVLCSSANEIWWAMKIKEEQIIQKKNIKSEKDITKLKDSMPLFGDDRDDLLFGELLRLTKEAEEYNQTKCQFKYIIFQNNKIFQCTPEFDALQNIVMFGDIVCWLGKTNEQKLWSVYRNGVEIGSGFEEVRNLKIVEGKVSWLGEKKSFLTGLYEEGLLIQNLHISFCYFDCQNYECIHIGVSTGNEEDSKITVYINGNEFQTGFDEVHHRLILTDFWWIGFRNKRWELYRNDKKIDAFDNFLKMEILEYELMTPSFRYADLYDEHYCSNKGYTELSYHASRYDKNFKKELKKYRNRIASIYYPITLSHIGTPLSATEQRRIQAFLDSDIKQIDPKNNKIDVVDQYKHGILMYGTLGFTFEEVFQQPGTHTAIAILGIWLQWYVRKELITNSWLQELLTRHQAQPILWWASFWLFFKEFLFFIPDKISFERLAISWELLYINDPNAALQMLKNEWNTPEKKVKITISPFHYSLNEEQGNLLNAIKATRFAQEKNKLIRSVMLYGNLGSPEIFRHQGWQIGMAILGEKLDHCLEQRFINSEWLKELLKQHPEETERWWRGYWYFFEVIGELIPDQDNFAVLTKHWEFFYSHANTHSLITTLLTQILKEGRELQLIMTELQAKLSENQMQIVLEFIKSIDDKKDPEGKKRYLEAVFIHGNFKLKDELFSSVIVQQGIGCLGTNFAYYLENSYLTLKWFNQVKVYKHQDNIDKWRLFWSLSALVIDNIHSKTEFSAFTERAVYFIFDNNYLDMQKINKLQGISKAKVVVVSSFDDKTIAIIKQFLNIDIEGISHLNGACRKKSKASPEINSFFYPSMQDLMTNFVFYFLWFGMSFKEDLFKEPAVLMAMAILGHGLAWYQEKNYINEGWLSERINQFNKPPFWWQKYWRFFNLLQGHSIDPDLFSQLTEHWDLLCKMSDDFSEEEDVINNFFNLLKQNNWTHYLTDSEPKEIPEAIEEMVQFFRKGCSVEAIDTIKYEEIEAGTNKKYSVQKAFSVSELAVLRRGNHTSENITLKELEEGINKLRSKKNINFENVNQQKKISIQSIIKSQSGVRYLWVRELLQNARDAMDKAFKEIEKNPTTKAYISADIDISHYLTKNEATEEYYFVIGVRDKAGGMNLWQIINLLLMPESSDPQKKALQLTGQFGIGFFTIFSDADRVEVRTGQGNGSSKGSSFKIQMRIVKNEEGEVKDIIVESFDEFHDFYKGTEVKRIKCYIKDKAISGHIEALFFKRRILLFGEGMVANIVTYRQGKEEFKSSPQVNIAYKNKALAIKRELYVAIPVNNGPEELGELKIYSQNDSASKVEQQGLFVSGLKFDWLSKVPLVYQEIVANSAKAIIIELPPQAKLTTSRDDIIQDHNELIKIALFIAYLRAVLYLYLEKNVDISVIPLDFYATNRFYKFVEPDIFSDATAINECQGQWGQLKLHFDNYINGDKSREAIKLLTRIKYNGVSLFEAREKEILDASEERKKMFKEAELERLLEAASQNNPMKILDKNEWNLHQKILSDIVQWLYDATGIGFYDVVFFQKEVQAEATAGSARLNANGKIEWKLRLNCYYSSSLWQATFEKMLTEQNAILELIFNLWLDSLLQTIAHEYAHVLEYEANLAACLNLLDEISMPKQLHEECTLLIKQHFASLPTDIGRFSDGNTDILESLEQKLKTIVGQEDEKSRVLDKIKEKYGIRYNLSHNDSFMNYMGHIIAAMLRSYKLKDLLEAAQLIIFINTQGYPRVDINQLLFNSKVFQQLPSSGQQTHYIDNILGLEIQHKSLNTLISKDDVFAQYLLAYGTLKEIKIIFVMISKGNLKHQRLMSELAILVDFNTRELMESLREVLNDEKKLASKLAQLYGEAKRREMESLLSANSLPVREDTAKTTAHRISHAELLIRKIHRELEELGLAITNLGKLLNSKEDFCAKFIELRKNYVEISTATKSRLQAYDALNALYKNILSLRQDIEKSIVLDSDERPNKPFLQQSEECVEALGNGACAFNAFGLGFMFQVIVGGILLQDKKYHKLFAILAKDYPEIKNLQQWLYDALLNFSKEKYTIQHVLSDVLRQLSVELVLDKFSSLSDAIKYNHLWSDEVDASEYQKRMLAKKENHYEEWGSILELRELAYYFSVKLEVRGIVSTQNDLCGAPSIVLYNANGFHFDCIIKATTKQKALRITKHLEEPSFSTELNPEMFYLYKKHPESICIVNAEKIKIFEINDLSKIEYVPAFKQMILHHIFQRFPMAEFHPTTLNKFLNHGVLEGTSIIETDQPNIFGWKVSDGHAFFINLDNQKHMAKTQNLRFLGAETADGKASTKTVEDKQRYQCTFFTTKQPKNKLQVTGKEINVGLEVKIKKSNVKHLKLILC